MLEQKLTLKETAYWVEILNKNDVPTGEILSLEDALNSPQVEHRNTFNTVNVEGIGDMKLFNMTAKFNKTPGLVEKRPPFLSEHTNEILNEIGYSTQEINELKEKGII